MGILLARRARTLAALLTVTLLIAPAAVASAPTALRAVPGDICGDGGSGPQLTTTDKPEIHGTLAVDEYLEVDTPTWEPAAYCVEYAWYHDGVLNELTEFPEHYLGPDSLGAAVKVVITGYQSVFTPGTVTATAAGRVAGNTFTTTRPIGLEGNPRVGGSLRGKGGDVQPAATLHRGWLRDGDPIRGANGRDYRPVLADLGHRLSYVVVATRPGYATQVLTSRALLVGRGQLKPGAPPRITGVPKVGRLLRASPGRWAPAPTVTSYQWVRSGVAIRGATGPTYRCKGADRNHGIRVRVAVARPGYSSRSRISDQVTCR